MPRNLVTYGLAVIAGLIGYWLFAKVFGGGIMFIAGLACLVVCGFIIVRNLQTNRKVADATPEQRTAALTFAPVADKAALYVLRNQFVGHAVGINIQIDGKPVAQLKSPRFTRILLSPGSHRLTGNSGTAKPSEAHAAEVNATAGAIIVMRCMVEAQMVSTIVKFTPTTLDEARADLQKTRMVAPDVAEV